MLREISRIVGFPGVADFPIFPEGRGQTAGPHISCKNLQTKSYKSRPFLTPYPRPRDHPQMIERKQNRRPGVCEAFCPARIRSSHFRGPAQRSQTQASTHPMPNQTQPRKNTHAVEWDGLPIPTLPVAWGRCPGEGPRAEVLGGVRPPGVNI